MKTILIVVLIFLSLNIYAQSFDIGEEFIASGYMGDISDVVVFSSYRENPHSPPLCFMFRYKPSRPSNLGWGGLYWQNSPDNWGDTLGVDFSKRNFTKIVFWAKGETGNEMIEFKAGGINKKRYKDSFAVSSFPRRIPLTVNWVKYEIVLTGQDLSSVIGGFAWVASTKDNPSGVTFYLDDIKLVNE